MYIPKHFAVTDREKLIRFIKENSFGILFSQTDGRATASHLPFLLKEDEGEFGALYGHMAMGNHHWREIEGEVLVVFPGPHAYVSPTWYEEKDTVPTWNYVAVHVYGTFSLIEDHKQLKKILYDTIDFYESHMENPWTTDLETSANRRGMKGIKGFRIRITEIQGKWKLNQHHPLDRQQRTVQHMKKEERYDSREIARLMQENIDRTLRK
ncbi:FMN-binding negative transcriptional regulator [Polycladomyces sp. WAk]|uniref:FMN-binding negative transcriptional regulator n=1 Tax=Polycladomyces zharkentensis TaxID=2807616 RepID=A0ABS2WM66_9BACL|nr:FMN-binding negative transcriptional regulator [Polycladomyces sp. WAk]MBN2910499.1 FMN-binding negative transcriptional regulator [Polycladomyces sp. WAk]